MIDRGTWSAALGRLQLEMSNGHFAAWLKQSSFIEGGDASLVVGLPNAFARETVDRNFRPIVKKVIDDIADCDVVLTFVISADDSSARPTSSDKAPPAVPRIRLPNATRPESGQVAPRLDQRYTFDNFVAGEGSSLAYAAARRASESPGASYNPLFIYGGVGLGKTHLLKAMGHQISETDAGSAVHFVTSEEFTHELVTAIRTGQTPAFRARFRSVDVLLMDDVQFIAGRESTQQEVFHTFDTLYSAGKQIVLTSDRSPQTIHPLSDRLITRFGCGLVVDIRPPDYETRKAILRSKTLAIQGAIPDDVVDYVASNVTTNVRDLEGALTRVLFVAQCANADLNVEVAQRALQGTGYRGAQRFLTLNTIVTSVAQYFDVSPKEITGPSRQARFTRPRHIAMYLMREETTQSLPAIGAELGGRDHTTVLHGYRKIERQLLTDPEIQLAVETIRGTATRASAHYPL